MRQALATASADAAFAEVHRLREWFSREHVTVEWIDHLLPLDSAHNDGLPRSVTSLMVNLHRIPPTGRVPSQLARGGQADVLDLGSLAGRGPFAQADATVTDHAIKKAVRVVGCTLGCSLQIAEQNLLVAGKEILVAKPFEVVVHSGDETADASPDPIIADFCLPHAIEAHGHRA